MIDLTVRVFRDDDLDKDPEASGPVLMGSLSVSALSVWHVPAGIYRNKSVRLMDDSPPSFLDIAVPTSELPNVADALEAIAHDLRAQLEKVKP